MTPRFAMSKTTPDGIFRVDLVSETFAPEHDSDEISDESLLQLVSVLQELAQTIRQAVEGDGAAEGESPA